MSLFAEIDADRKVLRVVVCDSITWLQERLGGTWVEATDQDQTEQYAGPGMYRARQAPRKFIQPWRRPDAESRYRAGAWVHHNGRAWESQTDDNDAEPGSANWRDAGVPDGRSR